jgi:periplasmic divalent cation tolerance protein
MTPLFVYITTSGPEEARKIGTTLVEMRLAACVNILPPVESIYHWKGAIARETETVFIAKTRQDLFGRLSETVRSLHSYTNPCIVGLPIKEGSAEYLQWIADETASA